MFWNEPEKQTVENVFAAGIILLVHLQFPLVTYIISGRLNITWVISELGGQSWGRDTCLS